MKIIAIILLLSGCSLVDKQVRHRLNETKIRNEISAHNTKLKTCLRPKENVALQISVDSNKQIAYFKVISKKSDKELTDCLFNVLDLIYFKNITIEKPISIKYLLTAK